MDEETNGLNQWANQRSVTFIWFSIRMASTVIKKQIVDSRDVTPYGVNHAVSCSESRTKNFD